MLCPSVPTLLPVSVGARARWDRTVCRSGRSSKRPTQFQAGSQLLLVLRRSAKNERKTNDVRGAAAVCVPLARIPDHPESTLQLWDTQVSLTNPRRRIARGGTNNNGVVGDERVIARDRVTLSGYTCQCETIRRIELPVFDPGCYVLRVRSRQQQHRRVSKIDNGVEVKRETTRSSIDDN